MIKKLTQAEAQFLRAQVRERFERETGKEEPVEFTQYKPGYKELIKHILTYVPKATLSVSATRLRKLFYYTDPIVCPADKLESPNFGEDFIAALYLYTGGQMPLMVPPAKEHRNRLGYYLPVLVLLLIVAWYSFQTDKAVPWMEDFEDVSMAGLQQDGWEFIDYDSTAFCRQYRPGYLTLYTLQGDYWYTPPDTPWINNLLIKKISGEKGKITIKFDDFSPTESFQQLGLFLFDEEKNRKHYFRFTFAASIKDSIVHQKYQPIKMDHGVAYEFGRDIINKWHISSPIALDMTPMWYQIQFHDKKIDCYVHRGEENASFWLICSVDFNFSPSYVGIGAFRGIRDGNGNQNNSSDIPAYIDYVKFEHL